MRGLICSRLSISFIFSAEVERIKEMEVRLSKKATPGQTTERQEAETPGEAKHESEEEPPKKREDTVDQVHVGVRDQLADEMSSSDSQSTSKAEPPNKKQKAEKKKKKIYHADSQAKSNRLQQIHNKTSP